MNEHTGASIAPSYSEEDSHPIALDNVAQWQCSSPDTVSGKLTNVDQSFIPDSDSIQLLLSGVGSFTCTPPSPIPLAEAAKSVQLWAHIESPFAADHLPELTLHFGDEIEVSLGILDFTGWHLLNSPIASLSVREFTGISVKNVLAQEESQLIINHLSVATTVLGSLDIPTVTPPEIYHQSTQFMSAVTEEEVTHDLRQEDFSFILEARSLSSVIRFIYTPIEGTLADIELEINNGDPIKPTESGGITIQMGGREWEADDDEIERHFVSCELVGECVEARWQWKHEEESADFLYRFSIQGKSLAIELEGGNGKATGIDLGHVTQALHPRLIRIPYFTFGNTAPQILCTTGVFISSFLDWDNSLASNLYAPLETEETQPFCLNGGCTYFPHSDSKRTSLKERIFISASRQFEEVLPHFSKPIKPKDRAGLQELVWYHISELAPAEEAYVEIYERLLQFKYWGLYHLMVSHPGNTWHDNDSNAFPSYALEGAPAKGGDDALSEYLEALSDLGYKSSLYANIGSISPLSLDWHPNLVATNAQGQFTPYAPGQYLLKPLQVGTKGPDHVVALSEKFGTNSTLIAPFAKQAPWDRIDCDARLQNPGSFSDTTAADRGVLNTIAEHGPTIGEGGTHWFHRGILHGHIAGPTGPVSSENPLFVDFDLYHLHPYETDVGLGSPEEFFGAAIPEDERHAHSAYLDQYLATTIAYGHAGYLPNPQAWSWDAVIRSYFLLQKLQTYYLGVEVASIHYHHDGNLLETNDALISAAYENNQVQIIYANDLKVMVNGNPQENWSIEHDGQNYILPPFSFFASGPDDFLAYSADAGQGHIDYVACADYLYYDTRGVSQTLGPITIDGAALILHRPWQIDVYPLGCSAAINLCATYLWPDRRMPKLRLLGFTSDEEDPTILKGDTSDDGIRFDLVDGITRYRITLPEWMVEPGR